MLLGVDALGELALGEFQRFLYPTPNITLTIGAFETGKDVGEFGVYLYNAIGSARVSIVQTPAIGGGNVSIKG